MAIEAMPASSRAIFGNIINGMMKTHINSKSDIVQYNLLAEKKQKIRNAITTLQEQYANKKMSGTEFDRRSRYFAVGLARTELDYITVEQKISRNDLYYKRLEILHNMIALKDEDRELEDYYDEYLEALKDEVVKGLRYELDIARLTLRLNGLTTILTKTEEDSYRNSVFALNEDIKNVKKYLKLSKIDVVSKMKIDDLISVNYNDLFDKIYPEYSHEVPNNSAKK